MDTEKFEHCLLKAICHCNIFRGRITHLESALGSLEEYPHLLNRSSKFEASIGSLIVAGVMHTAIRSESLTT